MLLSCFRNLQQLCEEIYQEGVAMRQAINDKDDNTVTEEETTKKQKCKRKVGIGEHPWFNYSS